MSEGSLEDVLEMDLGGISDCGFDLNGLPPPYPNPIDIENIYRGVYSELRDRALDAGLLEWTMYRFVVKGRNERAAIRKRAADCDGDVHLKDGFVLANGDAGPDKLTWSRLSACLLFDNCMNERSIDDATAKPPSGYDPETKTFVPAPNAARSLGDMAKYVPSMSTAIPWDGIAASLPSETMRWILLNRVRFACGPGFNFVWRIYQAENRGAENLLEAGYAFLIGAFYLDLAGMNARRRRSHERPLTAAEAAGAISTLGGTFVGLLTNCSNLEPPWNLKDVSEDILREALVTPLTTVLTRAAKRRVTAGRKRGRLLRRCTGNGTADDDPSKVVEGHL
ncbi:hypothetical protein V5799_021610 [Amblyomma americanum]|uniref:Uncharacterized protein n=1 Tax=Amblyomma americanum TaxID=6943 RepID=A0AAQ4FPC2_AMBAM